MKVKMEDSGAVVVLNSIVRRSEDCCTFIVYFDLKIHFIFKSLLKIIANLN